jgi:hypothetical protein
VGSGTVLHEVTEHNSSGSGVDLCLRTAEYRNLDDHSGAMTHNECCFNGAGCRGIGWPYGLPRHREAPQHIRQRPGLARLVRLD